LGALLAILISSNFLRILLGGKTKSESVVVLLYDLIDYGVPF
jgi:hypothetical protein